MKIVILNASKTLIFICSLFILLFLIVNCSKVDFESKSYLGKIYFSSRIQNKDNGSLGFPGYSMKMYVYNFLKDSTLSLLELGPRQPKSYMYEYLGNNAYGKKSISSDQNNEIEFYIAVEGENIRVYQQSIQEGVYQVALPLNFESTYTQMSLDSITDIIENKILHSTNFDEIVITNEKSDNYLLFNTVDNISYGSIDHIIDDYINPNSISNRWEVINHDRLNYLKLSGHRSYFLITSLSSSEINLMPLYGKSSTAKYHVLEKNTNTLSEVYESRKKYTANNKIDTLVGEWVGNNDLSDLEYQNIQIIFGGFENYIKMFKNEKLPGEYYFHQGDLIFDRNGSNLSGRYKLRIDDNDNIVLIDRQDNYLYLKRI